MSEQTVAKGPDVRPSDPSSRRPAPSLSWRSRSVGEAGRLARALIVYAPRRTVLALLLLLASSVTEAFGIVILIPFLGTIGLAGQPGEQGFIVEAAARVAGAVGVELTLPVVLGMFLVLTAVRAATGWQRNVVLAGIAFGFVERVRKQIYAAVARARWEFLLGRRHSDVQHVLTTGMHDIGWSTFEMLHLTAAAVLVLVQTALVGLISPSVCGLAVLAGGTLLLLTQPLVRRSHALGAEMVSARRALHGYATDFLAGLKLAKSYHVEESHVRRFVEAAATVRRSALATTAAKSVARGTLDLSGGAALAMFAWFAVSTAELTLPELLILAAVFVRVLPVLSHMQGHVQQLVHMLPEYAHAQGIYRALQDAAEASAGDDQPLMRLRRGMAVRHVSFAYANTAGAPALADADLDVPAGTLTAIAGPSGAGKTTLADLLLGLIEPAGGEVLVDGVPLTGSNLRRWRRSVAYVPQDSYLFHDTIRANLQWARPEASEADLWRALRLAAAEFVAALPEGLDTVVGDRGARLSGGERQRIALARALIREPTLLVLDEATSQIDAETERCILTALHSLRGRMTMVVIAHRTALLEGADTIVMLKAGRVVAAGTWNELSAELMEIQGKPQNEVRAMTLAPIGWPNSGEPTPTIATRPPERRS